LILKVKMADFCTLLRIDFKVCRLITETVSDHIRKTATNRRVLLPLFPESLRGSVGNDFKSFDLNHDFI